MKRIPGTVRHHPVCAALAVLLITILTALSCATGNGREEIRFVALTDTHIASDSDLGRWRSFLYTVSKSLEPDFILVLGDIVGHAPEFEDPSAHFASRNMVPVYMLPGNHDDNYGRDPEWWSSVHGRMHYRFEAGGVHFIMNWSLDTDKSSSWLRGALDSIAPDEPLVFCQHHPPSYSGYPDEGPWPLLAAEDRELLVVLSGHRHMRVTDTLDLAVSETLKNCSMDGSGQGSYYLMNITPEGSYGIEEYALDELALEQPPNEAPVLALDDTAACLTLDSPLEMGGSAADDGRVDRVEWRIDFGPWQRADGAEDFSVALSPGDAGPGHHLVWLRAVDDTGLMSGGYARAMVRIPGEPPPPATLVLTQGLDGYDGCRDATVRRHAPSAPGDGEELECWVYGEDGAEEFSEFYIAFDLEGLPRGREIGELRLVLYCCRQNKLSPALGDDLYRIAAIEEPWSERMNFEQRPSSPGFVPGAESPVPARTGEWPVPSGRQVISPALPLTVDLSEWIPVAERWMWDPASNHGWVFSALGENYNISFHSSECRIATMRPRLEIVFQE